MLSHAKGPIRRTPSRDLRRTSMPRKTRLARWTMEPALWCCCCLGELLADYAGDLLRNRGPERRGLLLRIRRDSFGSRVIQSGSPPSCLGIKSMQPVIGRGRRRFRSMTVHQRLLSDSNGIFSPSEHDGRRTLVSERSLHVYPESGSGAGDHLGTLHAPDDLCHPHGQRRPGIGRLRQSGRNRTCSAGFGPGSRTSLILHPIDVLF